MALAAERKVEEAKRMQNFLDLCTDIGVSERTSVKISAVGFQGEAEIWFNLEALRHLVAMEE